MMRVTAVAWISICAASLGACTTVKLNHDNTNSITHAADADPKQLANRACRKARSGSAVVISTVNRDASLPPGTGKQITTFRCVSD